MRWRRPSLALVMSALCLCIVVVGCSRKQEANPQQINVMLCLIDTLRADRVGTYGYNAGTTPVLDVLAKEGVVFENCYTPAPWTLPTVVSLHTSTWPCDHGVLLDGQVVSYDLPLLAELLHENGFATGSFVSNSYAGEASGLFRGFEMRNQHGGTVDYRTFVGWMSSRDKPFFAYIHSIEPHDPYTAPPEFLARFGQVPEQTQAIINNVFRQFRQSTRVDFKQKLPLGSTDNTAQQQQIINQLIQLNEPIRMLYDAEICVADSNIGATVDVLKQKGAWDKTLFIVFADHGDEFGEHGYFSHDQSLYEELIRVPLIVHFPGNQYAGTRVKRIVNLIDLMPTILSLVHVPIPETVQGGDLLPLVENESSVPEPATTVVSFRANKKKYFKPFAQTRGNENIAIRKGNMKGILSLAPKNIELYDLAADPHERNDLSAAQPELATQLRRSIMEWLAARPQLGGPGTGRPLSEGALDSLRNLGYIE